MDSIPGHFGRKEEFCSFPPPHHRVVVTSSPLLLIWSIISMD